MKVLGLLKMANNITTKHLKTNNMSKQTAIEWLIEKMSLEDVCKFSNQFAEAKEMEKQQIIDAYIEASENPALILDDAEQYYNETFKNK